MLAGMREHLISVGEIQAALAKHKFKQTADIAEAASA